MLRLSPVRRVPAAVTVFAIAGAGLVAAMAGPAGASLAPKAAAPSCALAPASLVKSDLGLAVTSPKQKTSPNNVGCYYPMGVISDEVTIVFTTHTTAAQFASLRKSDALSAKVQTVANLGSSAFAQILGSGSYAIVTVETLKGSTALSVGYTGPLAKGVTLAKAILAKL